MCKRNAMKICLEKLFCDKLQDYVNCKITIKQSCGCFRVFKDPEILTQDNLRHFQYRIEMVRSNKVLCFMELLDSQGSNIKKLF